MVVFRHDLRHRPGILINVLPFVNGNSMQVVAMMMMETVPVNETVMAVT
jgi:hypothetical protein